MDVLLNFSALLKSPSRYNRNIRPYNELLYAGRVGYVLPVALILNASLSVAILVLGIAIACYEWDQDATSETSTQAIGSPTLTRVQVSRAVIKLLWLLQR